MVQYLREEIRLSRRTSSACHTKFATFSERSRKLQTIVGVKIKGDNSIQNLELEFVGPISLFLHAQIY